MHVKPNNHMVLIVLLTLVAGISAPSVVASQSPLLLRIPYHRNQLSGEHNNLLFSPFLDHLSERVPVVYLEPPSRGNRSDASALAESPAMPNCLTHLRISTASVRAMGHAHGPWNSWSAR